MRQDVTVGLQQPPEPRTYPALQAPTTHQPLLEPRSMDENLPGPPNSSALLHHYSSKAEPVTRPQGHQG